MKHHDKSLTFRTSPWRERFGSFLPLYIGGPPEGKCTWDCIYCTQREERALRHGWVESSTILSEARKSLGESRDKIETILISANADPSLHPEYAFIVQGLRDLRSRTKDAWKIGCLVNGATMANADLREAMKHVDLLSVKLDASEEGLFERVNRPHDLPGGLTQHLKRLREFKEFHLQTTLWQCPVRPELQNWTPSNLEGLYNIYRDLRPKSLHLTSARQKKAKFEILPIKDADLTVFALRVEELGIPVTVSHAFPGGEMIG